MALHLQTRSSDMRRAIGLLLGAACAARAASPLFPFPASLAGAGVQAAALDPTGNIYVTGTAAPNLATTAGAFQTVLRTPSCYTSIGVACPHAFVAKFSAAGRLMYATYLGGSRADEAFAIAVDPAGIAWVTGYTASPDFPLTSNALQSKNAGGTIFITPSTPPPYQGDVFITAVNPTGTALVYSSFLGGTGADVGNAISIDPQGAIYIAGQTLSSDFPVAGGLRGSSGPGFVAKLNPAAPAIVYSTYFEVGVKAMALDAAGAVYLAGATDGAISGSPGAFQTTPAGGADAYVAKLTPDGSARVYATLLAGSRDDQAYAVAVDSAGSAWVAGFTSSADFPFTAPDLVKNGAAFIARLSADGSALIFSARIGSRTLGAPSSVLLDSQGTGYVSGIAPRPPLLLTPDALETATCDPYSNFISKWSPQGDLLYSSYSREGLPFAIDSSARLYLFAGNPVRLDLSATDRPSTVACYVNAASFTALGIAPGEIISLFGEHLGPDQPAYLTLDATGKLASAIGETRVLFDGIPAAMLYADSHQINVIAPWAVTPGKNTSFTVEHSGVASAPYTAPVIAADPGVFQLQPGVSLQGAILNEDGTLNSSSNPSPRGSVISIFGTGMGLLTPLPQDGAVIQDTSHTLQLPLQVLFSGLTTGEILYAGAAPTLPAGVIQINVRLPNDLPDFALANGSAILMRANNGLLSSVLATVACK